ncbi:2'-5'-oligoadenylate synthase 2 [Microtus ochrogaster]|uniref:2'-5' oligoadenylate synthase n=1 Tax=Microtus ochrogaster TaxID=79684 RepID=A0ABM1TWT2_MICOH|nr:2'-5'-oligoadenylate synthase 2 [Microtus ochrogaster]
MDLYQSPASALDKLVAHNLQPSPEFTAAVRGALGSLDTALRKQGAPGSQRARVIRIAKGGAYARGTALRGGCDAELVVFLNCFRSFGDQKTGRTEILGAMRASLESWGLHPGPGLTLQFSEPKAAGVLQFRLMSADRENWVDVSLTLLDHSVDFDVLPAFDALGQLRPGSRPDPQVYKDLIHSYSNAGEFSTCFTELQRDFISTRPTKLKSLIRLVKHWYQQVFGDFFMLSEGASHVGILQPLQKDLGLSQVAHEEPGEFLLGEGVGHGRLEQASRRREVSFGVASGKSPPNLSPPQPTSLFITPSHLLDTFIKDFLQPNEKFLEQIKKAVNIVCEFLKNNCFKDSSTKVLKAIKGGSTAKGTALKNGSDADIVVFLSSLKSYNSQIEERALFVQEIQRQLEVFRKTQELEVEFEPSNWKAPRVLSFTLKSRILNESVDFDVLPAYDALGQQHPGFTSRPEAYKDLIALCKSSGVKGGEFSTCFTELQREFIKSRPTKLKSLIRLVKHWYKQCERKMKPKASLPPKYALELLTVYAWEQGSGMEDFDTAEGFRTVLDLVIKYQQLCIFWTVNYNFKDEPIRTFLLTQIQKKRPVILDPADPTGDVGGGDRWCWHLLAKEANEWLSSLCFELQSGDSWQRVQPWKVPVVQTPGSCGAHIYPTVGI